MEEPVSGDPTAATAPPPADVAVQAVGDARGAEAGAADAKRGARDAQGGAEQSRDAAAGGAGGLVDELLLDEEGRRLAAQVSTDQPFGVSWVARICLNAARLS